MPTVRRVKNNRVRKPVDHIDSANIANSKNKIWLYIATLLCLVTLVFCLNWGLSYYNDIIWEKPISLQLKEHGDMIRRIIAAGEKVGLRTIF